MLDITSFLSYPESELGVTEIAVTKKGILTNEEVLRGIIKPSTEERKIFKNIIGKLSFKISVDVPDFLNHFANIGENVAYGTQAWTNPENIPQGLDPVTITLDPSELSYYLKTTDYGFNIPSNATIEGIKVYAYGLRDSSAVPYSVKLVKEGVISGKEMVPDNSVDLFWGDTDDLWGLSLTPTDVNSSNFGVAIAVKNKSTTNQQNFKIEYVKMIVYYSLPFQYIWKIRPFTESSWTDLHPIVSAKIITSLQQTCNYRLTFDAVKPVANAIPAEIGLFITTTVDATYNISTTINSSFVRIIG